MTPPPGRKPKDQGVMEMVKHTRWIMAGLGAAAIVVAVERSGAQAGGPQASTWTLAQVDGRDLPAMVETEDACRDEVVSGTLTLAESTWTLETVDRETCEGREPSEERDTESGTYTRSGQTLAFTDDDGDGPDATDDDAAEAADEVDDVDVDELATGTEQGGTLTIQLHEGHTLVFRR